MLLHIPTSVRDSMSPALADPFMMDMITIFQALQILPTIQPRASVAVVRPAYQLLQILAIERMRQEFHYPAGCSNRVEPFCEDPHPPGTVRRRTKLSEKLTF